jgi:hypothetical protein
MCFRRNEKALADRGIYYARISPYKHCNGLAGLVAKKNRAEVRAFIHREVDKARSLGIETMLMSAESLYAMTIFFHRFNGRQAQNYWELESEAVESLFHAFPADVNTRLVVLFRRQDQFLESLYRQMIVAPRAITMPIEEFRNFVGEALDYGQHMKIWSAVFPHCTPYNYEQACNSVPTFFLREVLGIDRSEEFEGANSRVNVRLNRDLVEYKRELNREDVSSVERRLSMRACLELGRTLRDESQYQDFLSPHTRAELLRKAEEGNALLTKEFGMSPFRALVEDDLRAWEPYPGLSVEKLKEFDERHARIKRRTGYRIERLVLIAREFFQRRLPMFAWLVPIGLREYVKHTLLPSVERTLSVAIRRPK